ncbi:bifunctional DNA-binding transcriptional regulator/O6-methylguanine-DNA methyltransferase Ada [Yersinia entomophaga]|uniref:bifunctional DNA-binding transcriptional regulator/O6-methylguanine-DNA methyltransferase Ada n=1 Tax=Yersinia entomophaga TaxID=935293 RepID=UPI0007E39A3E|nr:bifunctional DNA-binding transcriptional regulator/O6-methylguanine-DNA methyltransferase Ada [Yersinia entomophaga]OWF87612.1 bifunctional transcriptional regulator/O6-methylguanine-DNA methyltransferase [Yersinia entomophaga]
MNARQNFKSDRARWLAIVQRNKDADGAFIYGVKTTGIYCLPSCPSRQPRQENVVFFANRLAAEVAGFRPCKRCGGVQGDQQYEIISKACRYIEKSDHIPTLNELADYVGQSAYHFHRRFKAAIGLTPKGYAEALRTQRIRQQLAQTGFVTDAIFEAGYQSNARFYHKSNAMLGMTPKAFHRGGTGTTIYFAVGQCSLGDILVAKSERGICAIWMGESAQQLVQELQDKFPQAVLIGGDEAFDILVAQVVGCIETPEIGLDLPLDIRGTAFQQRVWQALREIPLGATASYSEIADKIGLPKAVRAVAGACAANMLAVAIPCHRVVRQDGALSGYRWGVERKRALLKKEGKQ